MTTRDLSFETRVIHAGQDPEGWMNATQVPVVQSASHIFKTAEDLSDVFAGKSTGHIYMRLRNPTNEALERRVSDLEGAAGAVATSSGMAAVSDTVLAICRAGDHIVASISLFMSSYMLFMNVIKKFGIDVTLVEPTDLDAWKGAVQENTKLFFFETIGNPALNVPDIRAISDLAHENNCPLIVDNTMASPWLCRPIEHGADIVLHSTTKYLNGHGSAVGGVILDSGNFDWPEDRYPDFKPFKDRAGNKALLDRVWREIHINFGTSAAPWHSYLTLIGIDTLALRMERHCENAMKVAKWLKDQPKVEWVNYPGLEESDAYDQAAKQFAGKGFGGMVTFGLKDEQACFDLIRNLELIYHLANLGDSKSLVIHPYSSQYISFPEEKRTELGILPNLVRLSVGIEAVDDIIQDLENALAKT